MHKESIIAIGLGLALGVLVAAGAVYYTVKQQRTGNAEVAAPTPSESPSGAVVPTVVVQPTLDIKSPQSGVIVEPQTIKIEGEAATGALMIVQSAAGIQSKKLDGVSFSFDFPLALGENAIIVSSYPPKATIPVQKKIFVYRII